MKWIIRIALAAAANGLLLLLAAVLFDKFALTFTGWLIGAVLFTVITVALRGLAVSLAGKYASGATWAGGLVLTWAALLLTDWLSDGFTLEGFGTWIFVTVMVWIGTLIYDLIDDRLLDAVHGTTGPTA